MSTTVSRSDLERDAISIRSGDSHADFLYASWVRILLSTNYEVDGETAAEAIKVLKSAAAFKSAAQILQLLNQLAPLIVE
jgi:hypothetical protein